jgi:hypothetical protein
VQHDQPSSGFASQGQAPQSYGSQSHMSLAPKGFESQGFHPEPMQAYSHLVPQDYQPQSFQPQSFQPQNFQPQVAHGYEPQAPHGYEPQPQAQHGFQPQAPHGYQPQPPQGFPLQTRQGYSAQDFQPQALPTRVPGGSRSQEPTGYQQQAALGYQPQELPAWAPQGYQPQAYVPPMSQGYPPQPSHGYAPQSAHGYAPQTPQPVQPQTYPPQGFVALGSYSSTPQPQQDQGYPTQNGSYGSTAEQANAYPTQGLIAPGIAPTTGFITPGYEAFQAHSQQPHAAASQEAPHPVIGRVTNRIASSTPGHGAVMAPSDPVRWVGAAAQSPQGYSDAPSRRDAAVSATPHGVGAGPRWDTRDEAPRYAPPGTEEIETDPFGLLALPDQHHYRGPRQVPDDATAGLLFGVLSFAVCLAGFVGYRRSRRAQMLISSAPNRFRGGWLASLGIALNLIGPVASLFAFYLWWQS